MNTPEFPDQPEEVGRNQHLSRKDREHIIDSMVKGWSSPNRGVFFLDQFELSLLAAHPTVIKSELLHAMFFGRDLAMIQKEIPDYRDRIRTCEPNKLPRLMEEMGQQLYGLQPPMEAWPQGCSDFIKELFDIVLKSQEP